MSATPICSSRRVRRNKARRGSAGGGLRRRGQGDRKLRRLTRSNSMDPLTEFNLVIWTSVCGIDYRCDNRRFWLSAHNCQVPTPTSQNLEIEQEIGILGADYLINCLNDWNPQFLICRYICQKSQILMSWGLGIDNPCRIVFFFFEFADEQVLRECFMAGIFGILESSATQWYQCCPNSRVFLNSRIWSLCAACVYCI